MADWSRRFCVAPMLDCTDRHARYFMRKLSRHAMLYTEMITANALIFGDRDRHLRFDVQEHPLALQLGGSEPEAMAQASVYAAEYGYDEININVGCPSDRVQSGSFGACLMAEPDTVAACVTAMRAAVDIPITVKTRIGIDEADTYTQLEEFVQQVKAAGVSTFIIHARKAWLKGLSPKENRDVPPLDYERVYQLKREHPELEIIINGGIKTIAECEQHLKQVDGVMLGREVYHNPWILNQVDQAIYGQPTEFQTREQAVASMQPYIEAQLANDTYLKHVSRHMIGLYHGQPGARNWRRTLSEKSCKEGADYEVLNEALSFVTREPQPIAVNT